MDSSKVFEILSKLSQELSQAQELGAMRRALQSALEHSLEDAVVCLSGDAGCSEHPRCARCPGLDLRALDRCALWNSSDFQILPLQSQQGVIGLLAAPARKGGEPLLLLIAQQACVALEHWTSAPGTQPRPSSSAQLRSLHKLIEALHNDESFPVQMGQLLRLATESLGCSAGFLCWCEDLAPTLHGRLRLDFHPEAFRGLSELAMRAGCTVFENNVDECEGPLRSLGIDNILLAPVNPKRIQGKALLGWVGKATAFDSADAELAADFARIVGGAWDSWSKREFLRLRSHLLQARLGESHWLFAGHDFLHISHPALALLGCENGHVMDCRRLRHHIDPAQRQLFDSVLATPGESFHVKLRLRPGRWEELSHGDRWLMMQGHPVASPLERTAFVGTFAPLD